MTSRDEFLAYHQKTRARTQRLMPLIPPASIEWRPVVGAFSFGDLIRHVAGLERWMWAETIFGRPSRYPGHGPELADGYQATMDYASRCHHDAATIFLSLTGADMERRVLTPGGADVPVWKWLRAMIEHEAHHRGQLYLMLRLQGIAAPPLFGLTSEELRAEGESGAGPQSRTRSA